MDIRKRQEKNIIILYPEGKIDINSANFIEETGKLLREGCSKLLCNFNNVNMVDYNGLSTIAIAYKNVINKNGVMKFCNVPMHIKELFKVVRLDLVFDVYDNEDEAIRSFETTSKIDRLYLRRRFKRIELRFPIKYSMAVSAKPRILTGKILNISGDGVFIYTKQTFPVSNQLSMELTLNEDAKALKAKGIIVWLADKELQPHCYPGMGVKFIKLDSNMQKNIIDFIDKNITHRSSI
ncbi:MAG: PilZ domain-containing protein [Candidatus Omnitrophica bacterium]|nr:PilZ domain-containing protein [Candidatus Omnitrophota bacterium]